MRSILMQRYATFFIAFCLVGTSAVTPTQAAIISTESAIELDDRQQQVDRAKDVLAQDNVRSMLVSMGVDPVDASSRVDALTTAELQQLNDNLERMPAAGTGIIEVVGIVAIVLIVLELLNVTNFFTEF